MRKGRLEPGQRLEIRRIVDEQAEAAAQSDWLVSQLLDDPEFDNLMIAAPIDAFRVVDWPVGSQVEMTYIEPLRGIWHLQGQILDRGISDRVAYYKVRQKEKARRLQRRTHFRIDCTLEVSWQLASVERTENRSTDRTEQAAEPKPTLTESPLTAYTHDISGSGLQLISDIPVPVNSVLNLQLQIGSKIMKIKGEIVRCVKEKIGKEIQYKLAIQFIKIQHTDQESLIQTIFELQNQRLAGNNHD